MEKRITIVTGHYGSGKTEFSVNYALALRKQNPKTALVDLDIANPYFRSRERQAFLEAQGITVYSNAYGYDISADLPAISAAIRSPLEDETVRTVVDAGGDQSGARVLNQFRKYFTPQSTMHLCVINANRPETGDFTGAMRHIREIEAETGISVGGMVNNTHLLRETTCKEIWKGAALCQALSKALDIPTVFHCCVQELVPALQAEAKQKGCELPVFPIFLYMRPSWM